MVKENYSFKLTVFDVRVNGSMSEVHISCTILVEEIADFEIMDIDVDG